MNHQYISRVVDLTHSEHNIIYNMGVEEAREVIKSGDSDRVRSIDGQFALVAVDGKSVFLARSIGQPLRYFIAKQVAGPSLVVAERIDTIYEYLKEQGLDDQFHPSYTRMAPAHYITKIELLGCPDPNPVYKRFLSPQRNKYLGTSIDQIGKEYIGVLYNEIKKWLRFKAKSGPIGVSFSAGIDSGSIFLLTYHALKEIGESPSRLKAFTLTVEKEGKDLRQAKEFLLKLDLEVFLEPIEIDPSRLDWKKTVKVVEDYKPLDIQAATMNMALLEGIKSRYPEWKYLIDGDGGDENLKDYPIEENPELTIRSVFNNLMLYQEGWGVESMKHSLTYSGGLSRSFMRTYAPADRLGFEAFSPYTLPNVIEVAEGIPFIQITDWSHEKLYQLKGEIVSTGVKAITGMELPVYQKRRFQHGVSSKQVFELHFPEKEIDYRKAFNEIYD